MIVYAGAAQYIALNLLALGTGAIEIILTTFIVNIRHFLLSASLNEKSRKEDSVIKKMIYAFGITDETFSVAAIKPGESTAGYMFGLNGTAYGSWMFFLESAIYSERVFLNIRFGVVGAVSAFVLAYLGANIMVIIVGAIAILSLCSLFL